MLPGSDDGRGRTGGQPTVDQGLVVSPDGQLGFMQKSRRRPQKRSHTSGRRNPPAARPTTPGLIIAADDIDSREGGSGTPEDSGRLKESFLAEYPVCPDCQASWDLDLATKEMYPLDGEIGTLVPCPGLSGGQDGGAYSRRHIRSDDASSVTASPCLDLVSGRSTVASEPSSNSPP